VPCQFLLITPIPYPYVPFSTNDETG
jgi:hypothetical protein